MTGQSDFSNTIFASMGPWARAGLYGLLLDVEDSFHLLLLQGHIFMGSRNCTSLKISSSTYPGICSWIDVNGNCTARADLYELLSQIG